MAWLQPSRASHHQKILKPRRPDDTEKIVQNATEQLLAIPEAEFEKRFQHWQEHWGSVCCGTSLRSASNIDRKTGTMCFAEGL
jgi:hypothetical protein